MKRRRRKGPSPAMAAACGAAAGLAGGLVLTTLDRLVAPRLGTVHREREWDEGVADVLGRMGLRLSPRGRAVAGVGAGLAYAAVVGAGYGLARQRWQGSPATLKLLDAMLIYAAAVMSPEVKRKRPKAPHRPVRALAVGAVSSGAVFGRATAAAYKALSRRVG
jgi:hypothetical protein